ncbi:MAG: tyrosine-type recombinase/integrase [Pedobacter sp.]|nr:tyrosine-type recombinase/integrase [Pedobacter sp.]
MVNSAFSCKLSWFKHRVKISGEVSLYLQIYCNGEIIHVKLNISWPLKRIAKNGVDLLPRYDGDEDLQPYLAIIERERNKYWECARKFMLRDQHFTLSDVLITARHYNKFKGFEKYMTSKIKERFNANKIKDQTMRCHKVSAKWFLNFTGGNDCAISLIDSDLLSKFYDYLNTKMDSSASWCRIKDLKAYLNIALMKDNLPVNVDYKKFVAPSFTSDPIWLDKEEVDKIFKLYHSEKIRSIDKRDIRAFLFACFTGLRISDLKRWNKSWIVGNDIVFEPAKGVITRKKKTLKIPIIPLAKDFINTLETDTLGLISEAKYNKRLKEIASMAGIEKNLTSHVARHTFGTLCAINGIPVLIIKELLGHSSTDITMKYIHIAEQVKLREMMKLQMAFS